jgi:hypothetical protein
MMKVAIEAGVPAKRSSPRRSPSARMRVSQASFSEKNSVGGQHSAHAHPPLAQHGPVELRVALQPLDGGVAAGLDGLEGIEKDPAIAPDERDPELGLGGEVMVEAEQRTMSPIEQEEVMHKGIRAFAIAAILSSAAFAQGPGKAMSTPASDLKWTAGGIPGVSTAIVDGDMAKGPSHFCLKYDAGFAAPVHHHSADHYATTVSGNPVLIADGKERRLAPGSYFAFTGKAKHAARCEGSQACVMFIDARSAWDVVPEASN